MTSIISIFNKQGGLEDTIEGVSTTRSWILNKYGRCTFPVPYKITDPETGEEKVNPKLTLRNFQYGNFVHIRHVPTSLSGEDGAAYGKLPDWVGVILPNRTWNDDTVLITVYSCEALLAYRSLPMISIDLPVSESFKKIIEFANNESTKNTIQVNVGNVTTQSNSYQDNFVTNAYDHIVKLVQASNMCWQVRSEIAPSSNVLNLYADFFPPTSTEASTYSNFTLTNQNTKEKNPLMEEQGTIINDIFAYTQAATQADRKMQEVKNQTSFDDYGPLQVNLVFTGITDVSTLLQAATNRFPVISGPKKWFSRTVMDTGNSFSHLYLGNILRINEPNIGFNPNGGFGTVAYVKIMAISYDDTANEADLTIEVI